MIQKNIIFITIVFSLVLTVGCIQKAENEPLPETDSIVTSEESTLETTALLSFTEFFCHMTEQSKPYAYFQFAYQKNGEVKYIKTKTTCEDLIEIGASNDASKNPTLFGEQIKLHLEGENPIKITRENGDIFEVEESEEIRSFLASEISKYDNLKYLRNSNSNKVVGECLLIKDNNQHDRCLSFQAAFQQDIDICDKMIITSNQDLCKEWINNIKEDLINK